MRAGYSSISTGSHHRPLWPATGLLPLNWSELAGVRAVSRGRDRPLVGGLTLQPMWLSMIVSMYKAGASLATVISFVTGWMLWSTSRLPFELALFGPRFSALRMALYLVFPPLVGLMVLFLWS